MGKDRGSQLHQQYSLMKVTDWKLACKSQIHPLTNPYAVVSANRPLPGLAVPMLHHSKKSQGNEEMPQRISEPMKKPQESVVCVNGSFPGLAVSASSYPKVSQQGCEEQKWFYCVPYYLESGTSLPDIVHEEKLSTTKHGGEATTKVAPVSVQKRFLVFDQSSNGPKLIYSPLVASQAWKLSSQNGPLVNRCGSLQKGSEAIKDPITRPCSVLYDELNEHRVSNEESEMHEDTEELDALLYSDDSDCDDDETSTAHSPSEEDADEVTSRFDSTKRKRERDEEDDQSLLSDTVSSLDLSDFEDDVESSFVYEKGQGRPYSVEANKRLKREKIQDAVRVLQSIIPGGKGKNTALTLDDAIKYLRFLKLKAQSLGVAIA